MFSNLFPIFKINSFSHYHYASLFYLKPNLSKTTALSTVSLHRRFPWYGNAMDSFRIYLAIQFESLSNISHFEYPKLNSYFSLNLMSPTVFLSMSSTASPPTAQIRKLGVGRGKKEICCFHFLAYIMASCQNKRPPPTMDHIPFSPDRGAQFYCKPISIWQL